MNKKKLPFEPMFGRVLIDRPKVEQIGSIIIPQTAHTKYSPTKGRIIACGETCDEAIKKAVGKIVVFAKYAGDWIKIDDQEYFICQDEDILGVVHE
jgi:chaperonin GroES